MHAPCSRARLALLPICAAIGAQTWSSGAGSTGMHSGFKLDISCFSHLRIQWADPAVAANTGIDNIVSSVGAPVPEPAGWVLMLGGALLPAARRRVNR